MSELGTFVEYRVEQRLPCSDWFFVEMFKSLAGAKAFTKKARINRSASEFRIVRRAAIYRVIDP